jgi:mannose-6-phosphate isomerase-like protein (cupin superfamily)
MRNLRNLSNALILAFCFCVATIAQTPAPARATSENTAPSGPAAVKFFPSAEVEASFQKGASLVDHAGRNYAVTTGKRDKAGTAELHEKDTDVFYIVDGRATYVTGGKIIDSKPVSPGEIRGSGIEAGETRQLSKGDVIIIPVGTPHWFKEVQGPFHYFVVKVQNQ